MKKLIIISLMIFSSALMHAQGIYIDHVYNTTFPGKTDQIVMKIHLYAETLGGYSLQQLIFNTNGTTNSADILNAKVYHTSNLPMFNNSEQYGVTVNNPNGSFSFNGNTYVLNGHSYFWLVFDIAPSAAVNNNIDAECTLINITLMPPFIPNPPSPPGNIKVVAPYNGLYTVGTGGNFTNLTQAMSSLSAGAVSGTVTLEILNSYSSSTETFPVVIPNISGLGQSSQLTIRPQAGSDTISILANASAAIVFNGAIYVNIDGRPGGTGTDKKLKILNNSYNPAIIFKNVAAKNTLTNVLAGSINYNTGTIDFVSGPAGGCYWNTLSGCTFYNIHEFELPASAVYSKPDSSHINMGTTIENCVIKNFGHRGVYFGKDNIDITIKGCEIYCDTLTLIMAGPNGVVIDTCGGIIDISNNYIHDIYSTVLALYTARGIVINANYNWPELEVKLHNNFISMGFSYVEAHMYGITFNGYVQNAELYNNSIRIGGGSYFPVNSSCLTKSAGSDLFTVKNNLFINVKSVTQTGGINYAVYIANSSGMSDVDYNNLYSFGNNHLLGYWTGNIISTIEQWKSITGKDQHSISQAVNFVSDIDLHIAGASLGDHDLAGIYVPAVPFDIDGEPRPLQFPYMGADENLAYPLPVELISFSASVKEGSVILNWTTASEINNRGFELERKTGNSAWQVISFIEGKGTTTLGSGYTYIDRNVSPEKYIYRLKQYDFDGTYTYSPEIEVNLFEALSFNLEQNYPNPFNPSTFIQYEIPADNYVTLKVYDSLGEEVAVLVNGHQPAGRYLINFNAKELSTGVYFYEIRTEDFNLIKKMMYIK